MTTSTFDVGDLFSVLGARGIERQLQRIAGVGRVSVNPVSGSTTVVYDPGKANLAEIHALVAINALMLKRTRLTGIGDQPTTKSSSPPASRR